MHVAALVLVLDAVIVVGVIRYSHISAIYLQPVRFYLRGFMRTLLSQTCVLHIYVCFCPEVCAKTKLEIDHTTILISTCHHHQH